MHADGRQGNNAGGGQSGFSGDGHACHVCPLVGKVVLGMAPFKVLASYRRAPTGGGHELKRTKRGM